jgi:hypothetical protein
MTIKSRTGLVCVISMTLVVGCESVPLAPGADKVKITSYSADVASCKPVGNVYMNINDSSQILDMLRNQTIGLGGNALFRTGYNAGVAYRCE